MPTYTVQCVDERGAPYDLVLRAADRNAAMQAAAAKGNKVTGVQEQAATEAASPARVESLLASIDAHLAALRKARLARAPVGTIALSMILAVLLGVVLLFLLQVLLESSRAAG